MRGLLFAWGYRIRLPGFWQGSSRVEKRREREESPDERNRDFPAFSIESRRGIVTPPPRTELLRRGGGPRVLDNRQLRSGTGACLWHIRIWQPVNEGGNGRRDDRPPLPGPLPGPLLQRRRGSFDDCKPLPLRCCRIGQTDLANLDGFV